MQIRSLVKSKSSSIPVLVLCLLFLCTCTGEATKENVTEQKALKNIIVMIADGMGFEHLEATNYYFHGDKGKLKFEQFPIALAVSTCSSSTEPYDPEQVWQSFESLLEEPTDSAAAVTAMATGFNVIDGALSMDAEGNPLKTAMEYAEEAGKSTGVVTTSYFFDATPSGFVIHNQTRRNYHQIIQDMILTSDAEVIIGAGNLRYNNDGNPVVSSRFLDRVGGLEIWDQVMAQALQERENFQPWTLVETREQFQSLVEGETPDRLLGLAQAMSATQALRLGTDDNIKDDLPYQVPRNENMPTLREQALVALNVLDNNPSGFFLMIENEGVDETSHNNEKGRMIEEVLEYNDAVDAVIEWIETNSSWEETLLIVTADHNTGLPLGPGSNPEITEIINNGKGNMPGFEWYTAHHAMVPVPLFARGKHAELLMEIADETDPKYGAFIRNEELGKFLISLAQSK